MARARFSIGIDLGTTNSVLSFVPLEGDAKPDILAIAQWETPAAQAESPTLPSFLLLPEDAVAAQLRRGNAAAGDWVVGRLARRRAAETPGRIVHSAKSWLCHHTADRSAPILPWGSEDLTPQQKISPVRASALILDHLRGAWNSRFAADGFPFDEQEITVTVPASFDAAAQRLTLAAAEEAGFPDSLRLLEEPQAAFHCWLEQHDLAQAAWNQSADPGPRHLLVVDIGGGTSDFSLFELHHPNGNTISDIRRIAVSEHILLGGDNIDLAIAHFVEPRLDAARGELSRAQWDHLIASCRDLKEKALSAPAPADEQFAFAVPARGSGLIAGSQSATVTRMEIQTLVLDGFFPTCDASAKPYRTQAALREWGLPYASDSAVTRHLANFLRDRPRVNAVLFNGGSLFPPLLRERLRDQVAVWQDGFAPLVLENTEPALAVARGAARSGALLRKAVFIAAGAAHAIFLEVDAKPSPDRGPATPSLVCVLPRGAAADEQFDITDPPFVVRTDRLVRFRAYSSSRHGRCRAGDILEWRDGDFSALPPLQTIVRTAAQSPTGTGGTVPVRLTAKMNALGLLQISCVSVDPAIQRSWPLEFNLRPQEQTQGATADTSAAGQGPALVKPNASPEAMNAARNRIKLSFAGPHGQARKITAPTLLKSLESILASPRSAWNAALLRNLWPALDERADGRKLSVDHEEAWLTLSGLVLRPGFGVAGDDLRIDSLWQLCSNGPCFPGRRIKVQEYLLWRRIAGGLTAERQQQLLAGELERLRSGKASAELVRLAGSLELISRDMKVDLVALFIDQAAALARAGQPCSPQLAALGRLLNRAPLHAGPETVVSPDLVERAYDAFRRLDWTKPELLELQTLFLRAARVTGDRSLDVPKRQRDLIAVKLEQSGVVPLQIAKIRGFVPVGRADLASLYDESMPPGLALGNILEGTGS